MDPAILVPGYGLGKVGNHVLLFKSDLCSVDRTLKQSAVLMAGEHLEHMICRRPDHLVAFSEDDSLKHVYKLCYISHLYSLAVLVEHIEVDRSDQRVSYSVLLIEEAGIRSFLDIVPCTPFVDHETDPAVRIVPVHNC